MSVAPLTTPSSAATYQEPTHRFGRALDDRLPFSHGPSAANPLDDITTASVAAPAAEDDAELTFNDVLDMVNPLQHLPIVSTIYREVTGDEIGPVAKVVGGGLFGGIIGAAVSLADIAIESVSGDDVGGHIMTALFGDDAAIDPAADGNLAIASNEAATKTPAIAGNSVAAVVKAGLPKSLTDMQSAAPAPRDAAKPAAVKPEVFDSPAIPNLSAGAFDSLMQSFGTMEPAGTAAAPEPGLAYAAPVRPGRLIDSTL